MELENSGIAFRPITDPAQHDHLHPLGGQHWYEAHTKNGNQSKQIRTLMDRNGIIMTRLVRVQLGPYRLDPRMPLGAVETIKVVHVPYPVPSHEQEDGDGGAFQSNATRRPAKKQHKKQSEWI